MKKVFATIFGISLFIAGSAYTHRQAAFVAHQKQVVASNDAKVEPAQIRPQLKQTVAYHLVAKQ